MAATPVGAEPRRLESRVLLFRADSMATSRLEKAPVGCAAAEAEVTVEVICYYAVRGRRKFITRKLKACHMNVQIRLHHLDWWVGPLRRDSELLQVLAGS